jgi:hypothetical protein
LLDPLIEHTSFVLDDVRVLLDEKDRPHRVLEYHGTLRDGRLVLLGFYQHSAPPTITAEMWVTDDATRMRPDACIGSVARRRQVWSYCPATDAQNLARTIVTEVTIWLQSFSPTIESDSELD